MMDLVRWNPFREMAPFRRMDRFFGDSLFPSLFQDEEMSVMNWKPVVDIFEDDDNIVIKADLPGVDKEDVHVDVKDRVLTLSGERSSEKEVKEEKYYRKERTLGKFQRSFSLSADVDPDKIKAEFKDGVLKVEIPKPEENKPRKIAVH